MPIRNGKSRRKEKERKKIKLTIESKDFGPISSGKIALKPLTLFIGPNNSGKSYAAMLIHSIFESYAPSTLQRGGPFFMRRRFLAEQFDIRHIVIKEFPRVKKQMGELKEGRKLHIPGQFIEKLNKKILESIYEKRLSDEIIRSYASPLEELIRIGKSSFGLEINFNSYGTHLIYQKDKLKIKAYPQSDIKIGIKATKSHDISIEEEKGEVLLKINERIWKDRDFMKRIFPDIFCDICISKILEHVSMPCYYLPAARSGILQGHKALAASIVKKAPYVGIERLEIPKFSGVVSDFISSVLTLTEEKGPFYQLAQVFEKELIEGQIVIRSLDEYVSEIKYHFQDTEIPLHRASSTVSELAPLFLYLKYTVEPGSILIIEEPEAHLHPGNQRILAKFLVRLVRKDVNIVITTHSEYLLEQLSSFLLISKVSLQKRAKKYKYRRDDFLRTDEVVVYVFDYDRKSGGHKISEVGVTEEDGISQGEFLKIHEALYEERIKLYRDITGAT